LILRQLDRLEERTRNIVTRSDLEALRKELVARDSLEPELTALRAQTLRVDTDRVADRLALEKRVDALETEQISKQDRLWIRLGQIAGLAGFALAMFELLTHLRVTP
jgi:wyosine [tRNA(Phe)-imidazoG37] synthetase (radical SAM superfamily)